MATLYYAHFPNEWVCPRCELIPKGQILSALRLCEECLASFSSPDRKATKCKACDPTLITWSQAIKLNHDRMAEVIKLYRDRINSNG